MPTRGMINPVPVMLRTLQLLATLALAAGLGGLPPAAADEVADFYRGRQIQVVIGHEVGGGYDVYGRLRRPLPDQASAGQSARDPAEHGRRGKPQGRQLALQHCGAGRQRHRRDGADHAARSGAQAGRRVVRRRAVQLDRQSDHRQPGLLRLAYRAASEVWRTRSPRAGSSAAARAPAPIRSCCRRSSTTCSARTFASSPAIRAPTTSCSRWSAAR